MRRVVFAMLVGSYATGCATNPDRLSASYVSPVQYNGYNCDQVLAEKVRVERRVSELTGKQAKASRNDKVAKGVGLVLFWPALFFLAGGDHAEELKRLKGEYEALEVAWIDKECDKEAEEESADDPATKVGGEQENVEESSSAADGTVSGTGGNV